MLAWVSKLRSSPSLAEFPAAPAHPNKENPVSPLLTPEGFALVVAGQLSIQLNRRTDMSDHSPFITITHGCSGFFAVLMSWDEDDQCYYPWTTGIGRYSSSEETEHEAKMWAEDEGISFIK
jgi:hypothetical protein